MENINNIDKLISLITLDKESEKKLYEPRYSEIMSTSFYSEMYRNTIEYLKNIRKQFSNNMDFYKYVVNVFAKQYISIIIKEYEEYINEEQLSILQGIYNGNGIQIFNNVEEANVFVQQFGRENVGGNAGAFRFKEYICFTPDESSKNDEIGVEESIDNASRMLGSMIHETMHILINVTKRENFDLDEPDLKTGAGSYLNEGLVEMFSQDLAIKYGLIHNPALFYTNNVELCRMLKSLYGSEIFEQLAFEGDYLKLLSGLSEQQITQYRINERIRYLERKGKTFDPNNIILDENNKAL